MAGKHSGDLVKAAKKDPVIQKVILFDDFAKAEDALVRRIDILNALRSANALVSIERAGIGSVGRAMEAAEWALTDYVQKEKALLAFEEAHPDQVMPKPRRWLR